MPGRKFSNINCYRFSINGQEKETELNEHITTAEFWEYDARIGRRWNIYPIEKIWQSGYACFNNNPNVFADPSGLDGVPKQHKAEKNDTYSSIAKKYGVTIDDLRKWNKYGDKNIPIGSTINISDPTQNILIGGSEHKAGNKKDEDFQSSTSETFIGKVKGFDYNFVLGYEDDSNNELLDNLDDALTDGTFGDQDDEASKIAKHFGNKSGADYHVGLSTATLMTSTSTFKETEQRIRDEFRNQMALNNGNYSKVILKVNVLPNFTPYQSLSLKTLIGGTQQLDVWLTNISYGQSNTYTADITFRLYDNFGLSKSDITDASFAARFGLEGLQSMLVLQKQRGFLPFRIIATFKMKVNGKF